jgi:3D (Asp-Asp-Asp) domain-containing protein
MNRDYAHFTQGKHTRERRLREIWSVIIGSTAIFAFILTLQAYAGTITTHPGADGLDPAIYDQRAVEITGRLQGARGSDSGSQVDTKYHVDLTDHATRIVAAQVKRWYSTMDASVSAYSLIESCHNRKNGVCIAANGKAPRQGITVACPRSVPLGTRVTIPGMGEYTCQDRTARWIEEKYGPTFDIFMKDHGAALDFGRKKLAVTIVYYTQ